MDKRALGLIVLLSVPLLAHANRKDAELALVEARAAVDAAERAGAAEHASVELNAAHAMLSQSEGAFDAREWRHSALDAEKADADARLAEARSRQHRAEAQTAELEAAVAALRTEINR